MKSWISIRFYLWKNTFSRWREHPVSPFAKVLLPLLLGLLGFLVLALFSHAETQLRDQLARQGLRTIVVNEVVIPDDAPGILLRSLDEESMWSRLYGEGNVITFRQPLVSASMGDTRGIPVLAYSRAFPGLPAPEGARPGIHLFQGGARSGFPQRVNLGDYQIYADPAPMPQWLAGHLDTSQAVAVPLAIATPLLRTGYISNTIIEVPEAAGVPDAVTTVRGYYQSEERRFRLFSAEEILANLERLAASQRLIRTIIFAAVAVILALMLGNVAMLEYRQDAYLLALLRSFGVPRAALVFHTLMENILLVGLGMLVAWFGWRPLYLSAAENFSNLGVNRITPAGPSPSDFGTLLAAAAVGVLLAMLPILSGVRKPVGTTLQ